jgi:hypothetical protein
MEMREFGLGLLIDIIVLDVSYPKKLTMLNLEFYNSIYRLITERGLGHTLLDSWPSS